MVRRVCRSLLDDPNDAEDAFQAAFLVLARKAGSLRRPELLGNWLFGTAHRAARKLRRQAARRRKHEGREARRPDASAATEADHVESHALRREQAQAVLEEVCPTGSTRPRGGPPLRPARTDAGRGRGTPAMLGSHAPAAAEARTRPAAGPTEPTRAGACCRTARHRMDGRLGTRRDPGGRGRLDGSGRDGLHGRRHDFRHGLWVQRQQSLEP